MVARNPDNNETLDPDFDRADTQGDLEQIRALFGRVEAPADHAGNQEKYERTAQR